MRSEAPTLSIEDVVALFDQAKNQHAIFQSDLSVQTSPQRLTGGVLNDVYRVETSQGPMVIKWCRGTQLDPSATATHDELFKLQKCLFGADVCVPEPYAYLDNFRGNHVFIMQYIDGLSPINLHKTEAKQIGALIANFHRATQNFPDLKTKPNDVKSLFSEIYQSICRGIVLQQPLRELSYLKTLFSYAFSTLWFDDNSQLPSGLRHADIHAGNILMSEDKPYLLDFELCIKGALIDDIANAICMLCLPDEKEVDEQLLQALLEGYQSIRPLTLKELDYLPTAFKNRMGLEKVSNLKLNNSNMPNGSNFNNQRAKTLTKYIESGQWTRFRKTLEAASVQPEVIYVSADAKDLTQYYQLKNARKPDQAANQASNDPNPALVLDRTQKKTLL